MVDTMDAGSEMDVGGEPRRSSSPVVARSSSKKKDRGDSADAGSPTAARVSVAGSTHQARSRITLVCMECKRLKLKCDRRTPCDQCVKRSSESKCIYSQQAAEKVDVQSLHNRMLILESFARRAEARLNILPPGSSYTLRALLALGGGSSSISVSLDDISSLWLEHLDFAKEGVEARLLTSSVLSPPTDATGELQWLERLTSHLNLFKSSSISPNAASSSSSPGGSGGGIAVTPQLVAQLPAEPVRTALMELLEVKLRMHPSVPYAYFKRKIEAMFQWAESQSPSSPFPTSSSGKAEEDRPSLAFFAAAAIGFAIGAASWLERSGDSFAADGLSYGNDPPDHISVASSSARSRKGKEPAPAPPPSDTSSTSSFNGPIDPALPENLSGLSEIAMYLHRKKFGYASYDLDSVSALLLRILYLVYSPPSNGRSDPGHVGMPGPSSGRPELSHGLYPLIGQLVCISQMMGLHHDPDDVLDGSGAIPAQQQALRVKTEEGVPEKEKFSCFEKELRRRLWWAVYYWDVFISDAVGQSPQILDDHMSTHEPVDTDDDAFGADAAVVPSSRYQDIGNNNGNLSWFLARASLARLVKTIKKRTYRDPTVDDADRDKNSEYTIEKATVLEREIQLWLEGLPEHYRLAINPEISNTGRVDEDAYEVLETVDGEELPDEDDAMDGDVQSSQERRATTVQRQASPFLVAQRAELAMVAYRLLICLYVPFLRASAATTTSAGALSPAILNAVTAAHAVLYAGRVMHSVFAYSGGGRSAATARAGRPHPPVSLYAFAKAVFDAGVVSAHSILHNPRNATTRTATENLAASLSLLRDPIVGGTAEAIKVLELLRAKVDVVKAGSNANSKRKREDVDVPNMGELLNGGFQMPFVGASIGLEFGEIVGRESGNERPPGPSGALTSVPDNDSVASSRHAKSEQIGRSNRAKYHNKNVDDFMETKSAKSGGSRRTTGSRTAGSAKGTGRVVKEGAVATAGPVYGVRKREQKEGEEKESEAEVASTGGRTRARAASIAVAGSSTAGHNASMPPPTVVPSSHGHGQRGTDMDHDTTIFQAPLVPSTPSHTPMLAHPPMVHGSAGPSPTVYGYEDNARAAVVGAPYEPDAFERSLPNHTGSAYEAFNSQAPSQPSPRSVSFYTQHVQSPTVYSPTGMGPAQASVDMYASHGDNGGMAVPMPMGPVALDNSSPTAPVPSPQVFEPRYSISSEGSFTQSDRIPTHRGEPHHNQQQQQAHYQRHLQQQRSQQFHADMTGVQQNPGQSSGSQLQPQAGGQQMLPWSQTEQGVPPGSWSSGDMLKPNFF